MTKEVETALNHVRSVFPEVTTVLYTRNHQWLYMDDDGETPAFTKAIDVGLLESALNSLDDSVAFPVAFSVKG